MAADLESLEYAFVARGVVQVASIKANLNGFHRVLWVLNTLTWHCIDE
jgi:hypothetical protein